MKNIHIKSYPLFCPVSLTQAVDLWSVRTRMEFYIETSTQVWSQLAWRPFGSTKEYITIITQNSLIKANLFDTSHLTELVFQQEQKVFEQLVSWLLGLSYYADCCPNCRWHFLLELNESFQIAFSSFLMWHVISFVCWLPRSENVGSQSYNQLRKKHVFVTKLRKKK